MGQRSRAAGWGWRISGRARARRRAQLAAPARPPRARRTGRRCAPYAAWSSHGCDALSVYHTLAATYEQRRFILRRHHPRSDAAGRGGPERARGPLPARRLTSRRRTTQAAVQHVGDLMSPATRTWPPWCRVRNDQRAVAPLQTHASNCTTTRETDDFHSAVRLVSIYVACPPAAAPCAAAAAAPLMTSSGERFVR